MGRYQHSAEKWMNSCLIKKEKLGQLRSLTLKKEKIDFFSNDYLGLCYNKKIKESILNKFSGQEQIGSSGSRLLSGNSALAIEVEGEIANFFCSDAALFFISGFSLNVGLLAAIANKEDILVLDERIHASWSQGSQLSKAKTYYFKHNCYLRLEEKLSRLSKNDVRNIYVIVESIYSMDGDVCHLREIQKVCEKFKAHLIVDEAHAVGVMGKNGQGLVVSLSLQDKIFCRVVTFGKAFGASGAAILASNTVKNYLVNFCSSFIYTTAPSAFVYLNISSVIDWLISKEFIVERQRLTSNIGYMNQTLGIENKTPIYPFVFGSVGGLRDISISLRENKISCTPIFPPTVRRGYERLRVCIHSHNSRENIDTFSRIIRRYEKFWKDKSFCYGN
jgi:8-amino-7-oxononanoate synthase